MNTGRAIASTRPEKGRVGVARATAIEPCGGAAQPVLAASELSLDRAERQVHPGEGSA